MKKRLILSLIATAFFSVNVFAQADDDWPTASTIDVWYSRLPAYTVSPWTKTSDDIGDHYQAGPCLVTYLENGDIVASYVAEEIKHIILLQGCDM